MKLAVSALAWSPDEHDAALNILRSSGIEHIELIPARLHDGPDEKSRLQKFGLRALAFQALLYGTSGLHLFQSKEQRELMANHLKKLARLACEIGVTNLVFGSPSNRWIDPSLLTGETAKAIALDFFGSLNPFFAECGTVLCLEPNPAIYQCNFLTTTEETGGFVRELGCSNIRMNLDLGAVIVNQENLSEILTRFSGLIGHIHISEPLLAPVPSEDRRAWHVITAATLNNFDGGLKPEVASIEMKPQKSGLSGVLDSISRTQAIYG